MKEAKLRIVYVFLMWVLKLNILVVQMIKWFYGFRQLYEC
jgi:hypothetical protein